MQLLAAEGDTWGIAGPTFVKIYLIAAIASLVVTLIVRRWLGRGRRVRREPHPYEVAYLIGGRPRTIATAVAALRADGAIEASDYGRLRAAPLPRPMRDPLDAAIHTAVRTGRIRSARRLATGYDVRRALDKIQETLAGDGLVTGPRRRRWFRLSLVPPAGVLGVGIVRMVAGVQNHRPWSSGEECRRCCAPAGRRSRRYVLAAPISTRRCHRHGPRTGWPVRRSGWPCSACPR
jgi:hypothetical protein